jgi:hypothetical protein
MGHWQVLKLRIADFWSENAQDMIYQRQSNLVIEKGRNFTSTRTFLIVLLLLAFGGAIRDKPCLLSAARLDRVGSVVAYLAISWARVGDLNPNAEIGPTAL